MSSLFSGINVALRALLSHQQAIEVIEHNVANANTPGYRRQEAVLSASTPYPVPGLYSGSLKGQVGTGVQVDQVRQLKLDFYEDRYRRELGEAKQWDLQSGVLQQAEGSLAETSSDGLSAKLDSFWSGWQALSSDPSNPALRKDLIERSEALAQGINQRAKMLMALQKDQDLAIKQRVDEVNTLAERVAQLNVEIVSVKAAGGEPNDNIDERDKLLDRLAELTGATSSLQANGEALVSIDGHALVIGSKTFKLTTAADPENGNLLNIYWEQDPQDPAIPPRGELAGLLNARDGVIADQIAGLNQLAYGLAAQVNSLHQGPDGSSGVFFDLPIDATATFDPLEDYALEIRVDQRIIDDPAEIAVGDTSAPGDGNRAARIADLQRSLVMNGGTASLNQFYLGKIGDLGLALKGASDQAKGHQLVADSLAAQAESVSGVSLDEEAANLVKSQRAYQAAARVMTAIDEMIDKIINGMGVVGR